MCFQDNSLFPHFNVTENINIKPKEKMVLNLITQIKDLIKLPS